MFFTKGSKHKGVKASHRPKATNKTKQTSFALQACLRRQEYRRDPNEKHEDQTGGQETNSEKSQFSNGTSFKQVLRMLEDTFSCCECVCVCVCVLLGKKPTQKGDIEES